MNAKGFFILLALVGGLTAVALAVSRKDGEAGPQPPGEGPQPPEQPPPAEPQPAPLVFTGTWTVTGEQ